ncbi:MAG: multidrug efflux RND transporter permease subunit [Hydrogenophilales bacterium 12-64-6]|nr:MAG: multidrug efflux RND transporter permease subunit [Hydrogenophilales bacterium 12-64-6]
MSRFFIDRPVFAWVIAILIMLAGALSITSLPIAQYPSIAPPTIAIIATYPGASAKTLEDTVTQVIEQRLNGIDHLRYIESASTSDGTATITVTFDGGTNPDTAQVQVQNKVALAIPLLPQEVQQQGVQVNKSVRNFLIVVGLISTDGTMSNTDLADYNASVMRDPISRLPSAPGQLLNATVMAQSRLQTPEQFGGILLRVSEDGSRVFLRDVARIELGSESYNVMARYNGMAASGMAIRPALGANALETVDIVKKKVAELSEFFPPGVEAIFPYDTTQFVRISIQEVVKTLIEAVILVFVVMFIFLQSWRATLIPTIAVPVVLLGTFGVMAAAGYSINTLTLFGLVLAIGLLVDDAIVVVENVERVMQEEGLSPKEATRKSMDQISGALVGIGLVLSAAFVPMAFFTGSSGVIYRQFSLVIVSSVVLSVLVALILTPALCATMLKPVAKDHGINKRGPFGWFNRAFERTADRYTWAVGKFLKHYVLSLIPYIAIGVAVVFLFQRAPTGFLPDEDQGYFITLVQLPGGATQERTVKVLSQVEQFYLKQPEVERVIGVVGFSFFGRGQNAALVFTRLKDWDERKGPEHSAQGVIGRAMGNFMRIKEAVIFAVNPPPIPELGAVGGFDFRLLDRSGQGREALMDVRNMVLGMASQDKRLTGVRPEGQEPGPQVFLDIDREKAQALQIDMANLNDTLSSAIGVSYVNDFVRDGRILRVQMQADADLRKAPDDLLKLPIRNRLGDIVLLGEIAKPKWIVGLPKLDRYNGNPSMKIAGTPAPGHSTGEAMQAMEDIAAKLPPGFGFAWSGTSFEERLAGAQAPILFALSLLVVFLALAALYESWAIPFSVILVVPLGILGAVLAVYLRGLPNDVFFKVGLIAIIGLSAKNAILIIEFARQLHDEGMDLVSATLEACRLRLRPILMTSFAFILGVMPLAISTGAGAAGRHAVGTGVVGGMIAATLLAIFLVPVFFVVIRKRFPTKPREETKHD